MPFKSKTLGDQPVTRSRRRRLWEESGEATAWPRKKIDASGQDAPPQAAELLELPAREQPPSSPPKAPPSSVNRWPVLKQGHALSFFGLLLFTAVTYFRPYELIPALSGFRSMAQWLAIATILVFIPTQLSLEGTWTARPREINLVLLLLLAGLLSVPLALEPGEAWTGFIDFAKVITMFIVMVNVVRTEWRWRSMCWLGLLVGVVLSAYALNDYRLGNLTFGGDRIQGVITGGMFANPNDLSLHLVTMIPLALGLLFVARGVSRKVLYGLCALLMIVGMVVTFSRGGFLALICSSFVLAWKLGRRNRLAVVMLFLVAGAILLLFAPPEFITRMLSIFGGDVESVDGGSASGRQDVLLRSIIVSLRHPLLGIGMNNFHILSIQEMVSHNAYTQISAEMGIAALTIYCLFIWSALKRMRGIERETYDSRARSRVYYLAVGLQASLIGYMVSSFFASVAYLWYIYFLVAYALCLHRLYQAKGAEFAFGRPRESKALRIDEESNDSLAAPLPTSGNASRTVVV